MKVPTHCRRVSLAAPALLAVVALTILAAGCGKAGPSRLSVYGYVAYAGGQPFNGSITFLPAAGVLGPAAGTGVSNGYYRFDSTNGPTAGPHSVILRKIVPREGALSSLRQKNRPPIVGANAPGDKIEWKKSAEVRNDGPYQFDFKLEP